MAVATDIAQGELTTSAATLHTGAGTEHIDILFTNYSGSNVTIDVYINGSADANRIGKSFPLEADGGMLGIEDLRIGNTDTIQAKASAGSSVTWTMEITGL